jgi:hypothetical protein
MAAVRCAYTTHVHNSGSCYSIFPVNELVLTFPVLNVYQIWKELSEKRARVRTYRHTETHTNTRTDATDVIICLSLLIA